ncbi:MAG: type II toxin-antitoxin system Phd/YefM family antitoxin [Methylococcaceae bacterium]|nr:MAG: type II toxin-antitoxin system Phd/YefM family antitoxin [Methylococcaceae bacterium]
MKIVSAREAPNYFGKPQDSVRCDPVLVAKSKQPICTTVSIQGNIDTLAPECFIDKESDYDSWLFNKIARTLERVENGETAVLDLADRKLKDIS